MVTDMLQRVRSYLAQPGKTKAGLAVDAGLHPNTLRDADKEGWNPTAETLLKLEPILMAAECANSDQSSPGKAAVLTASPGGADTATSGEAAAA